MLLSVVNHRRVLLLDVVVEGRRVLLLVEGLTVLLSTLLSRSFPLISAMGTTFSKLGCGQLRSSRSLKPKKSRFSFISGLRVPWRKARSLSAVEIDRLDALSKTFLGSFSGPLFTFTYPAHWQIVHECDVHLPSSIAILVKEKVIHVCSVVVESGGNWLADVHPFRNVIGVAKTHLQWVNSYHLGAWQVFIWEKSH